MLLLLGAASLCAQGEQVFKGQITRCMCAEPGAQGATPSKAGALSLCTITCAKAGAKYVLTDTKANVVYLLSNQRKSKALAGDYVMVLGTLDKATSTIRVDQMVRALPPKVIAAKSIFIYCDACPRGMAKAKPAALEELDSWNRFNVLSDPEKADLVLIFSANPYLGDYVTRDGPDKRPVSVDITYMDVVDPRTGRSLWSDFRQWGSWRVGSATRSLIAEFKAQLDEEESQSGQQQFPTKHRAPNTPSVVGN